MANAILMAPVYYMAGRSLWYLATMAAQHRQMWDWWSQTQVRKGQVPMGSRYVE